MHLRAISVMQPFAWAITHGVKRVENRTWTTRYRGPLLIHASLSYYEDQWDAIEEIAGVTVPDELDAGGIVGICDLADVVTGRPGDPFFNGPYGFVLEKARPLPYVEWKGALNLWLPPASLVRQLAI